MQRECGRKTVSPGFASRRQFLQQAAMACSVVGIGAMAPMPAMATAGKGKRQQPDIAPLVRLIEDTPRDRLLEEVGQRIRDGLGYRDILAALFLAGVWNIQPRPVGFKFHAVMVVHSAHLASVSSPTSDRWLPLFWALDDFKHAQFWDAQGGDWRLGPVASSQVPPPDKAQAAFIQAMEQWDEAAADAAAVGLARSVTPGRVFDVLCHYGARDFRDIGHKAIYVANAWRRLQTIGWRHAEPIIRSVAYALLAHQGPNPAQGDAPEDRPLRHNQPRLGAIRPDWHTGDASAAATRELLAILRQGSATDASDAVVALLNRRIAPQSLWDALFAAAAEQMMLRPGVMALHAVTTTNAGCNGFC